MFDLTKHPENVLTVASTLHEAMEAIQVNGHHLTVVVNGDGRLHGIITDGDIRRALIAGAVPDNGIADYFQPHPSAAEASKGVEDVRRLIQETGVEALPVVDDDGRPVALFHLRDLSLNYGDRIGHIGFGGAVIMAGGEGRRLRPLTESLPKPLVDVGGRPVIDYLVEKLSNTGIDNLHVSINYLGDQIKEHLGDGSGFGTNIQYLEENQKLGTAGALSLLKAPVDGPILVMNGDILTSFSFEQMLSFHKSAGSALTVGVAEYHIPVPYGVFTIKNGCITGLKEKPEARVHINAGIYLLESRLIERIPKHTYYDMTSVIDDCLANGETVAPFLIHEDWIDIGNPSDLERARSLLDPKKKSST